MNKEIYYDLDTKNKNFKMISDRMYKRGIKNNKFHLTLLDKDLSGVDPFNPKLSVVMKQKILRECMCNYWYFLRECIKVEIDEVDNNDLFSLSEGYLRLHFAMLNNMNIITDLYSASENICIRLLWEFLYGNTEFNISLIDETLKESRDTLNEIRKIYDRLPKYLRHNCNNNIENEVIFENSANKNRIKIIPGVKTEENARHLGRGLTQSRQWYRNIADINFIDTIYLNSVPGFSAARINAKMITRIMGLY